jgi:hypothetical protein
MERFKMFLLGVLVATCFFLLIGAQGGSDIGRYQIEVIGTNPTNCYVYIVDTATGMVKTVVVTDRPPFPPEGIGLQLKKRFEEID